MQSSDTTQFPAKVEGRPQVLLETTASSRLLISTSPTELGIASGSADKD